VCNVGFRSWYEEAILVKMAHGSVENMEDVVIFVGEAGASASALVARGA